jgi:hypothetical protein
MNIFERASRAKLRFSTSVGEITTEQLWDLPLTSRRGGTNAVDLDTLARGVHSELKSIEEGSFVDVRPDPRKVTLELQLDVLKHVIQAKLDAKAAAEKAAENAERKRKLLSALANKEEAELTNMTKEQIEQEIARLDT